MLMASSVVLTGCEHGPDLAHRGVQVDPVQRLPQPRAVAAQESNQRLFVDECAASSLPDLVTGFTDVSLSHSGETKDSATNEPVFPHLNGGAVPSSLPFGVRPAPCPISAPRAARTDRRPPRFARPHATTTTGAVPLWSRLLGHLGVPFPRGCSRRRRVVLPLGHHTRHPAGPARRGRAARVPPGRRRRRWRGR